MSSIWVAIGAISGFLSVAFGAFGAHALAKTLDPHALSIYHTGAQYQMYHALALIGLGLWSAQHPGVSSAVPGWAFTAGTLLFSGSLYALALSGLRILGAITPLGGVLFLAGWVAFAFLALKA